MWISLILAVLPNLGVSLFSLAVSQCIHTGSAYSTGLGAVRHQHARRSA
jgi:hypothetical protein